MESYLNAEPNLEAVPSTQTARDHVVVIHCKVRPKQDHFRLQLTDLSVMLSQAGKGRTGTLACCLIERLGGPENVVKAHGMLNGRIALPGTQDDTLDDENEQGSITPRVKPGQSEEPTVTTTPVDPTIAANEKKKRRKSKAGTKEQTLAAAGHPAEQTFALVSETSRSRLIGRRLMSYCLTCSIPLSGWPTPTVSSRVSQFLHR